MRDTLFRTARMLQLLAIILCFFAIGLMIWTATLGQWVLVGANALLLASNTMLLMWQRTITNQNRPPEERNGQPPSDTL